MVEEISYDYKPQTAGGKFLTLKNKGDSVKIRIVSTPVHFQREWQGQKKERFAWLVIDRADGKIKVFVGGVSIYLGIRDLYNSEDWGDPTKYDITITRTEESPANYYRIVPSPKKTELTDEEREMIATTEIDLLKMFADGKGTNTFGKPKTITQEDEEYINEIVKGEE
jgi:hypothetical protein